MDRDEDAEAAAGSSAYIDEASAVAESGDDSVDGAGDLRQSAGDRGCDSCIFVVDEADDFERGHAIESSGGGEDLFGRELAQVRFRLADWGQVVRLSGHRDGRSF